MRRVSFSLLVTLLVMAGCSSPESNQPAPSPDPQGTVISGDITTATTWGAGSVYLVNGNISITSTLTIEPGAVVHMASGTSITVNAGATLKAVGTQSAPIVFQASSGAVWRQVYLSSGSIATTLKYVTLSGAGESGLYALEFGAGAVANIENCTICGNSSGGIEAWDAGKGTVIKGSCFFSNGHYGLSVGDTVDFDKTNRFAETGTANLADPYNAVCFWGDIGSTRSFDITEVPYLFGQSLTLRGSLSVDPGVTVLFGSGQWLTVDAGSTLYAVGTPLAPVSFRAKNQATRWRQIYLVGGSIATTLQYATVSGAGDVSYYAIQFENGSVATLDQVTLSGNAAGGVDASGAGVGSAVTNCTFADNGDTVLGPYDLTYNASVTTTGNSASSQQLYQ